jgi:hypothetical protein
MTTKKRGRPLSKEKSEKLRLKKLMSELPPYLPRLSADEKAQLEEDYKHNKKVCLEILETYKHGSWTPDEHAYKMASLGHESLEGYEQQIIDDDDRYSRLAKKIRRDAGAENKRKAEIRKGKVMEINKALIEKINNSDSYNIHRVATMIYQQWTSMSAVHRLAAEDKKMSCRGDGGMPASVRTITRWLEQHLSTFDKPRKKKILRV